MKKNFDIPLKTLDGHPLPSGNKDKPDSTTGSVCVTALLNASDKDNPSGEEKAKRYALALKIHAGGEVDVKADELALLKRLVGELFAPIVVGPMFQFLDTDAPPG